MEMGTLLTRFFLTDPQSYRFPRNPLMGSSETVPSRYPSSWFTARRPASRAARCAFPCPGTQSAGPAAVPVRAGRGRPGAASAHSLRGRGPGVCLSGCLSGCLTSVCLSVRVSVRCLSGVCQALGRVVVADPGVLAERGLFTSCICTSTGQSCRKAASKPALETEKEVVSGLPGEGALKFFQQRPSRCWFNGSVCLWNQT